MIFPEFSLNGKVALVTGGGRGLGLEIAKALASYGALVLVNNVGMRDRRGLFEFELDAVRRLIDTDLVAPFNLC